MNFEIQQTNQENKGIFRAMQNETEAGNMTYSWAGKDKIIIDHTEVNSEFRGQKVGNLMVEAAVNFARKENIKIIPLCPFAKSVFNKKPEYQDVI